MFRSGKYYRHRKYYHRHRRNQIAWTKIPPTIDYNHDTAWPDYKQYKLASEGNFAFEISGNTSYARPVKPIQYWYDHTKVTTNPCWQWADFSLPDEYKEIITTWHRYRVDEVWYCMYNIKVNEIITEDNTDTKTEGLLREIAAGQPIFNNSKLSMYFWEDSNYLCGTSLILFRPRLDAL